MAPRRFHSGALWQETRALKLRMQPLCEECLRDGGKLEIASVVHHRADVSDRPDLAVAIDNLQSLCRPCHERIHGRARCEGWVGRTAAMCGSSIAAALAMLSVLVTTWRSWSHSAPQQEQSARRQSAVDDNSGT